MAAMHSVSRWSVLVGKDHDCKRSARRTLLKSGEGKTVLGIDVVLNDFKICHGGIVNILRIGGLHMRRSEDIIEETFRGVPRLDTPTSIPGELLQTLQLTIDLYFLMKPARKAFSCCPAKIQAGRTKVWPPG